MMSNYVFIVVASVVAGLLFYLGMKSKRSAHGDRMTVTGLFSGCGLLIIYILALVAGMVYRTLIG